tara:strand:+ start:1674 stop:2225 length:552 start_codon:yes stop_codon:yes gene_type:complete
MSCNINKGRTEPCKDSVGGIQAVYFVDYGTLGNVDYSEPTSSEINAFDGIDGVAPVAYKYVLKGTSSLEQTITSSRDNGTTFYDQLVNMTFKKLSIQSNDEIALIAVARPHVIVEDNNGNAFMVGLKWGADVNGGTIVTGGAMGDLSGYTLTLQGMEQKPANFLSGGVTGVGIIISPSNISDI